MKRSGGKGVTESGFAVRGFPAREISDVWGSCEPTRLDDGEERGEALAATGRGLVPHRKSEFERGGDVCD